MFPDEFLGDYRQIEDVCEFTMNLIIENDWWKEPYNVITDILHWIFNHLLDLLEILASYDLVLQMEHDGQSDLYKNMTTL